MSPKSMYFPTLEMSLKRRQTDPISRQNRTNCEVEKTLVSSKPSLCTAIADLNETSVFTDRTKGPLDR